MIKGIDGEMGEQMEELSRINEWMQEMKING